MNIDLRIAPSGTLQQVQPSPVSLVQTGDNNTQIAHVDKFDGTCVTNVLLMNGFQGMAGGVTPSTGQALNTEY